MSQALEFAGESRDRVADMESMRLAAEQLRKNATHQGIDIPRSPLVDGNGPLEGLVTVERQGYSWFRHRTTSIHQPTVVNFTFNSVLRLDAAW